MKPSSPLLAGGIGKEQCMENRGTTIPVEEGTLIVIRTSAELYLSGIAESEVRLYGAEERVQIRQEEGVFRIENHSGMDLSVPLAASVRVERVGGDAFMQDLGRLDLQKVGGNLSLQRVNEVQIGRVGGDLTVRAVSGPFQVQKIGGNLLARELSGLVAVESVGGDGDVQAAGGENFSMRVGGNADVQLTRGSGNNLSIHAGGDASLYLPPEVNARIDVHSGGEEIGIRLNRQQTPQNEVIEERHTSLVLGGGDGHVELHAGGNCNISDDAREPSSLAAEFDRLEHSWQNARENRERYGWPGHFDPSRSAAWSEMVGRRAQEAARRAEMRAQSAVRRAEEHARRMEGRTRRRVEQEFGKSWNPFDSAPRPPVPPTPPTPNPVTEQERLMILQMLQENKITVEQAEALLRALEGRFKQ
jgi:hypothetical protein